MKKISISLLIIIVGIILFIPFLGSVHLFDLNELNYAEAAREMLVTNNFQDVQINYHVIIDKPPFFLWMQATSMYYFGINEFAARLPNALIGILTLLILFSIGKRLKDQKFGILWVVIYLSSFLPHFYFKTGLIDPVFNLFLFLSINFVSMLTENDEFYYIKNKRLRRIKLLAYAAFFAGLSVLTIGPFGLFLHIATFSLYFVMVKFKRINSLGEMIWFSLVFLMTIFTWYGIGIYENGLSHFTDIVQRSFSLQNIKDTVYAGPYYYHFIVLMLGCFPASILMFGGIKNHKFSTELLQNFKNWMVALIIVVLVIFSFFETKSINYSSVAYLPITFFATYFVYYYLKGKKKWKWYHNTFLLLLGIFLGVALTLIPLVGSNPDIVIGFINDEFLIAVLKANVHWSNLESLFGLLFILALIVSANLFYTKHKKLGLAVLLISCIVITEISIYKFIPKIEKYTQSATIEFYDSKKNEDCYIEVLGFESFAHLFYAEKEIEDCIFTSEELLKQTPIKPTYFISKNIDKKKYIKENSNLEVLYEKNGFVFYRKKGFELIEK